ncbi:hypothetical protein [Ancylobacter lacus]|uniref:hypothetical protein n=1 Tax=Ancylobacter lacus TaxID=2579970 RepID=UPI001BCCBD10|nr:hypothetical protein [Ancylobacter lacus]MBS7540809.1 hypothetical protein [Ancylobacter lacus]
MSIENGYDLLGVHPDSTSFRAPYWGYEITSLQSQTNCVGRVFNLNSGVAAGAPAGVIDKVYIKAPHRAASAGCAFRVGAQTGLRINSIEVNDAINRVLLLESCPNLSIGMLRFEKASVAPSSDLIAVAGESATVVIDTLEFQTVDFAGAGVAYGLLANVSARVSITGALRVSNSTGNASGQFRAVQTANEGRILLPPVIAMQSTDAYVRLYAASAGDRIEFNSAETAGPWFLSNVASASSSPAWLVYDPTTAYTALPSPTDGYLVGLFVYLTAPVSSGTLSVYPSINGATIGSPAFNVQITTGSSGVNYLTPGWDPSVSSAHRIAKGDRLAVTLNAAALTGGGGATVMMLIATR